jgi:hypothetical protein
MSPSVFWNLDWIVYEIQDASAPPLLERLYVDQGSDEDGSLHAPLLVVAYEAVGYVPGESFLYFREDGGHHDETAWGRRLPGALQFLLPASRGVSELP